MTEDQKEAIVTAARLCERFRGYAVVSADRGDLDDALDCVEYAAMWAERAFRVAQA